jgi:carbamoyltransferase
VQAAAGDAGGAVGAALLAGDPARFRMDHAYWGPEYGEAAVETAIAARGAELSGSGCVVRREADLDSLCRDTAAAIASGAVVGWFQGRMEWGPRALGNRSILCDPRRADMKELLNAKIKRRESFRPFAPSVLAESARDWFEADDEVPFMTQVYPVLPGRRAAIPAVTHVDGTGRLQTVTRAANPLYHALIAAFGTATGVPMVLNTSFNENEPVVNTPAEALDCFLRTRMDRLVLGTWVVTRG